MARAGRLLARTMDEIETRLEPGLTTLEINEIAEETIRKGGGVPTFLGYRGYQHATCTSPNQYVVHGIPNGYKVELGDLMSVDVGVTLDGFVADAAWTFQVGAVSAEDERLTRICQHALFAGLQACRLGNRVSDIGHAIESVVRAAGFDVVRSLVGHGIGRQMHEEPQIPNYGPAGRGALLKPGMTFAVEPMITAGRGDVVVGHDGWSIFTEDNSRSAHFEHTVAVTEDEPVILTAGDAPVPLRELSQHPFRSKVLA